MEHGESEKVAKIEEETYHQKKNSNDGRAKEKLAKDALKSRRMS